MTTAAASAAAAGTTIVILRSYLTAQNAFRERNNMPVIAGTNNRSYETMNGIVVVRTIAWINRGHLLMMAGMFLF